MKESGDPHRLPQPWLELNHFANAAARSPFSRLSAASTDLDKPGHPDSGHSGDRPPTHCQGGPMSAPIGPEDPPLFPERNGAMVTKECFNCKKVVSHEHLHDCAPGNPETHIVGSERFVCVLCKHVTFAGSEGASRFPFTFDRVAAGR
jgi:hypothetical protein